MNGSKEKPALNMRYYNKEIDDDLSPMSAP